MTFLRGIRRPFVILGIVMAVGAGAPVTSPRPVLRAGASNIIPTLLPTTHPSTRAQEAGLGVILQNIFRPIPRRSISDIVAEVASAQTYDPNLAIGRSPRPVFRPDRFTSALSITPPPANSGPRRGSVCGSRQIRGVEIAAIAGRLAGCGLANPVRISSISGVRLTQDAIMNCNTAKTLNAWVREGVIPAVGRRGRGVEALQVIAHYSCRTRNNQAGARISEHGKGHAIDIAGVVLKNGDVISVLEGWSTRRDGRILRAMHSSACGPFGTVLGPESDRFHRNHFHVDTAEYRSGSYCR